MKKILFLIFTIISQYAVSQDLNNFYSYSLGWSNINSAYVGMTQGLDALIISRSQFNGVAGSPKNLTAIGGYGFSDTQGVGIKLISDSRGIFNTTRFDGVYSQQFDFDRESTFIRFGLSMGVLNSSLNLNDINNQSAIMDTGDPELTSSRYNYTHFISGAGMVFGYKNLELGMSAPHIVESRQGFEPYLVGSAAYNYSIPASQFTVRPAAIYQNRPDDENIVDGFLMVDWRNALNAMAGYTSDERLRLGGGIKVNEFAVNYLHESPIGSSSLNNSTHEVAVRITIKSGKRKEINSIKRQLSKLLAETRELAVGNYDKEYLRNRLVEIEKELDGIAVANSKENSREVSVQLKELEGQILLIFEKLER